jgi:hypothetical protein
MRPFTRIYYSTANWRLNMFRAAHRSSSGALTVFAASGLHTHVMTGRSQVWVGTPIFAWQNAGLTPEPIKTLWTKKSHAPHRESKHFLSHLIHRPINVTTNKLLVHPVTSQKNNLQWESLRVHVCADKGQTHTKRHGITYKPIHQQQIPFPPPPIITWFCRLRGSKGRTEREMDPPRGSYMVGGWGGGGHKTRIQQGHQ